MHDLGKAATPKENWPKHIKHEVLGLPLVNKMCDRLRIPNRFRELTLKVTEYHTHAHRALELKAGTIWKLFRQTDALRKPERFNEILLACMADSQGRTGFESREYPQANYLKELLNAAQSVAIKDIVAQGISGAKLGEVIEQARIAAIANAKPEILEQYKNV